MSVPSGVILNPSPIPDTLFFNSHPSFFDASPYLIRQALDQSQDPGATPANKYLDFLDF